MASTIYALADPSTGDVRYIGNTRRTLAARMSHHMHLARYGVDMSGRSLWIRTLSGPPTIKALAIVEDSDGPATEQRFIAAFRKMGAQLVNRTDGGNGNPGWVPSAETKARISEAHRGKVVPREAIEKMVRANTGRKLSDEHRAKVLAKLADPEVRAKISAGVKAARAAKFWVSRTKASVAHA